MYIYIYIYTHNIRNDMMTIHNNNSTTNKYTYKRNNYKQ